MEQIEGVEKDITDEDLIEKLKIDGMALKYGNKNQRKNFQLASIAVKQNEKALIYVDPEIQEEVLSGLRKNRNYNSKGTWQIRCIKKISAQNNVILSSPTGSGKTKVFLQWAKQRKIKPIYITSPIKALSNQRYRKLQEQGFVVGIETGDVKNVPENCDFICCTQEIYTNNHSQEENATLIIDEFHYIFENHQRSRAYIDALHDTKAKNVLLCSATLGNIELLKQYIERVSRQKIFLL